MAEAHLIEGKEDRARELLQISRDLLRRMKAVDEWEQISSLMDSGPSRRRGKAPTHAEYG